MKLNKELLKQLYVIKHPSNYENEMTSFIINFCHKLPGITFFIDHYSNLFITKNTTNPNVYPCLIAHQDEAVRYKYNKKVVERHPFMYGQYQESKKQCALGADDANGIYVILHLLEVLPNLKCVFTVEEELGCQGAEQAVLNISFFENCQYFIQADRRGKSDLITISNGIDITSPHFLRDIEPVMRKHGYKDHQGVFTDVGVFVEALNLAGINVSCGYYNEHTMYEKVNTLELENCLNFIHNVIIHLGDKTYPHVPELSYSQTYYFDEYDETRGAYSQEMYDYHRRKEKEYLGKNAYYVPSDPLPCDSCVDFDCVNCDKTHSY